MHNSSNIIYEYNIKLFHTSFFTWLLKAPVFWWLNVQWEVVPKHDASVKKASCSVIHVRNFYHCILTWVLQLCWVWITDLWEHMNWPLKTLIMLYMRYMMVYLVYNIISLCTEKNSLQKEFTKQWPKPHGSLATKIGSNSWQKDSISMNQNTSNCQRETYLLTFWASLLYVDLISKIYVLILINEQFWLFIFILTSSPMITYLTGNKMDATIMHPICPSLRNISICCQ